MASPQDEYKEKIVIPHLKGLDERLKFVNPDASTFDKLIGLIPQRSGILQRANGSKLLATVAGKQILSIYQTLDRRQNVLVQTDDGLYLFSEDELMGRTIPTNLIPVTLTEEEDMAKAILIHSVALGADGGTYTTANVWQQAPLTNILSQLNPDGTAAAFVSALAANVFTLAAGSYRFRGYSIMSHSAASIRCSARLFNVTTGLPAWSGLLNENTENKLTAVANDNVVLNIEGDLVGLAAPTQFQIEGKMQSARATTGFGIHWGIVGTFDIAREVYRVLEILKTA